MSLESVSLATFLRVADVGSISRAAERLHLSQSAVTKQIRGLEDALGTRLFERTGRGVLVTPAGAILRDYGQRSANLLQECRQAIAELENGSRGQLIIGAGVTTSIFQLPGWLRAFARSRPGVDITVKTGSSSAIETLVVNREVDVGFVTSEVTHPDLTVVPLYEEEIVFVVSHGNAPAKRGGLNVEEYPTISFPPQTGFRSWLDRTLAASGIAANVKMESDSIEAIKSFVAVGLGGAFLPEVAVRAELRSKVLSRVQVRGLPRLRRRTAVTRRHDRYLTGAARRFLDIVKTPSKPQ
jgi:DNA-binding transcriptional LysR family regulator